MATVRGVKMKVLQVNCVYDYGSTGKITKDLHEGLIKQGIDSVVLYGRRQSTHDSNVFKTCSEVEAKGWNVLSRIIGHPYEVSPIGTNVLINRIKKEKPDIVHLQCLNGYFVNIYKLIDWLKSNKIPTVLTLHAEFMYTGGCGIAFECNQWKTELGCGQQMTCPLYGSELKSIFGDQSSYMWQKMKSAFEGFDRDLVVVSVSPWLMERASKAPILINKQHRVVYNGLDTTVFKLYDTTYLRRKHNCENRKVVFHATPAFSADPEHLKGGYYVIDLARRMPDHCFIVAGQVIDSFDVPSNLILLGKLDSKELLAKYYSMADATVLTSKRETFSMVCAESLCCGTPVVGFKAGAPEQIALKEYSRFVQQADLDQLVCAVENILNFPFDRIELEKEAQRTYAKSTMTEKYIELYTKLMHTESKE